MSTDPDFPVGTTALVVVFVNCPECSRQIDIDLVENDAGEWEVADHDRFPNCEECGTPFEVPNPKIAQQDRKPGHNSG